LSFQFLFRKCWVVLVLAIAPVCFAQQSQPVATRVINLGLKSITAFSIIGLPFRDVGLDARPGDTLTPAFSTQGQMDYDVYWQLDDASVHSAHVDLRDELPKTFYGDVVISLHDDRLAVSWSNVNAAWVEYRRVGDPRRVAMPEIPLYDGCNGVILDHAITRKAWDTTAKNVRMRFDPASVGTELLQARCNLDWYIPSAAAGRHRVELDEVVEQRLRDQWRASIDNYRAAHPEVSPVR
jgi:hypothetical protein